MMGLFWTPCSERRSDAVANRMYAGRIENHSIPLKHDKVENDNKGRRIKRNF